MGRRAKLRASAVLMLVQGIFMEGGVFVALIVLQILGVSQAAAGERFSFIVPYLQEHLHLMMIMSGIFGALRVIGAIGVLRNRLWGLVLSLVNCGVTLALMIFLLPAGIIDGLLSGAALILLLQGWLGSAPILAATDSTTDSGRESDPLSAERSPSRGGAGAGSVGVT